MRLHEKRNRKVLDYFILGLLVIQSNFPFFVGDTYLIIFTTITFIVFLFKNLKISINLQKYLISFLLIIFLQVFIGGHFDVGPFFGFILRILYAYMAITIIGQNFPKYFVNFIYFFSLIGLFFWLLLSFIPNAYTIFEDISKSYINPITIYDGYTRTNLIIYTNDYWLLFPLPRNAGPFWEPGGYGVFLVTAIMLNTLLTNSIINRKNIILLISVISTFSLGTYISFIIFILSYLIFVNKFRNKISFLAAFLLLLAFYFSYYKYEFLGEKLDTREANVQYSMDNTTTYANLTRQVGRNEKIRLDLKSFYENPVYGESMFMKYQFGNSPGGLSSFLRIWGVVGFLIFFGAVFYSFKRFITISNADKGYTIVALITIMAVGLSQGIYNKPIFIGFSVFFMVLKDYRKKYNYDRKISEVFH